MPRLADRPNPNTLVLDTSLLVVSVHEQAWGWKRNARCKVAGCDVTTETWERQVLARIRDTGWVPNSHLWAQICRDGNWDTGPYAWLCPDHYHALTLLHEAADQGETYDATV